MLILARWRGGVEGVVASQYIAGGVLAAIPYCQHKAVVNLIASPQPSPVLIPIHYMQTNLGGGERDGR